MDNEERITELEIRLSHQEKTIDEMNKTIYEQWQALEKLEKIVSTLKERVKATTPSNIDDAPYKPPHY